MQDAGQVAGKALEMLKELAGVAGSTVEKLWPMAVRATYAEGITSLVIGGVVATVAALLLVWTWKTKQFEEDDFLPIKVIASIMCIAATVVAIGIALDAGLPKIIAPEGCTINRMLGHK
jgi:asparagine N-glycosylation enzyme membrane subunit Stt3